MATCKECVHVGVCRYYTNELAKANGIPLKLEEVERLLECDDCENFKDRSRFVELPCNMGDTIYIALNEYGVLKDTVKEFRITSKRIWIRPEKFGMDCLLENMAFLTREAAEQALKEREENEKTDD